jgi:soluble lytic murein transglycosylase
MKKSHPNRLSFIARLCGVLLLVSAGFATPARADAAGDLRTALAAAAARDWDKALGLAPAGVAQDVIEWQRLRAGDGFLGEYEDFLARRSDWPGMPWLHQKGEVAVARSNTPSV